MSDIRIEKVNSVYNKIHCESNVSYELGDYFTFSVPGARFMKAVRSKRWDGKVRLFNTGTQYIYSGLNPYIEQFAVDRGYSVEYISDFTPSNFTNEDALQFMSKLGLTIEPRDYQVEAFVHAVQQGRTLLLSPTASGKSFIIFLILCYYLTKTDKKALIVVPTTSLVHQMVSDFDSYTNIPALKDIAHKIMYGYDTDTKKRVIVSTWQSIYKNPRKWFDQFSVVFGDEAHLFKAKSLTSIMNKMIDCEYRFGFTGTLDGSHTHKLVLEGLFGAVKRVTSTSELIDQKHLANFKIKCLVLKYPEDERYLMRKAEYRDEIDWLVRHTKRNEFIKKLAVSLEGNTLILFQFVEKHGKVLNDMLQDTGIDTSFVHGNVDSLLREDVRKIVEKSSKHIIVASYGTFSTGVNIKNLHNIVFASPSKSRIRTLQSIGRGLRKGDTKTEACLYDIADDLCYKSWKNHTIQHFAERIKIYGEEKFDYKMYTINLKD